MKSGLKRNVRQCPTVPSELIAPCVLMLPPPLPLPLWKRSNMCVCAEEFSGRLREKPVELHAAVSCSPAPKQSVAGPAAACASPTRLSDVPPLRPSFHIVTSQTGKVFGMKLACRKRDASGSFLQGLKRSVCACRLFFQSKFQNVIKQASGTSLQCLLLRLSLC